MIRYDLTCDQSHSFDSWFQSAVAFDRLLAAGHVACAICGSQNVQKAMMAPAIGAAHEVAKPADLHTPASGIEEALAAMRAHVERNSEYVGMRFVSEARAIHDGEAPERAIYGEARPDEARKLIEDGVPVAPLPFMPVRRTN